MSSKLLGAVLFPILLGVIALLSLADFRSAGTAFAQDGGEEIHDPVISGHYDSGSHSAVLSDHEPDASHDPLISGHYDTGSHSAVFSDHDEALSHDPLISGH